MNTDWQLMTSYLRDAFMKDWRVLMSWLETSRSYLTRCCQDFHLQRVKQSYAFHLINSLPANVAFQLKLQPQANYSATFIKARELQLIYSQNSSTSNNLNSVTTEEGSRLDKVEQS